MNQKRVSNMRLDITTAIIVVVFAIVGAVIGGFLVREHRTEDNLEERLHKLFDAAVLKMTAAGNSLIAAGKSVKTTSADYATKAKDGMVDTTKAIVHATKDEAEHMAELIGRAKDKSVETASSVLHETEDEAARLLQVAADKLTGK